MIADAVQQQYPGDVLLSEELAPIYHAPASVDQSAAGKSAHENVWVVMTNRPQGKAPTKMSGLLIRSMEPQISAKACMSGVC